MYQIASPGDHRLLPVERAIHTFKNDFISTLYGANRSLPANQCDCLLKQTVMTSNMVRQSWITPRFSTYHHIWGNFDFNWIPIDVPRCKTIVHMRPKE